MMQVRFEQRVGGRIEPSNVLQALEILLEKTNFYGTILLTYEAGQLKHIKPTQNFTVDSLIDYLSK